MKILSKKSIKRDLVFQNVALSAIHSKLYFGFTEWAEIGNGRIEVNLQKNSCEENEESFLMDILSENEQIKNNAEGLLSFNYKGAKYYMLAGTDNTPSRLCYDFSLAYLKLQPTHKMALYDDCIFGLEDILKIEENSGYIEDWSKIINQ